MLAEQRSRTVAHFLADSMILPREQVETEFVQKPDLRAEMDGTVAVIIEHAGKYTTLYAHLNGYSKRSAKGKRVKQGQVIGYVGQTGLATGPHLHYEFLVNGVHRNPRTVKLPQADPIADNSRREGRERNRRIQIVFLFP